MKILFFKRRKTTVARINKEIAKTSKALKVFLKIRKRLEAANERLSLTIQRSIEEEKALKQLAETEHELQEIALEKIAENMEALRQIGSITGEK